MYYLWLSDDDSKSEDKGWSFDCVAGQQLTIAKVAGVVAILIAILYGARVASGSLFAILQTAGAVVFGWPKQLGIALIFGCLAWVFLRP